MDISIYCRKPSPFELIDRALAENINAIVADLHAKLDDLAKEYQPKRFSAFYLELPSAEEIQRQMAEWQGRLYLSQQAAMQNAAFSPPPYSQLQEALGRYGQKQQQSGPSLYGLTNIAWR